MIPEIIIPLLFIIGALTALNPAVQANWDAQAQEAALQASQTPQTDYTIPAVIAAVVLVVLFIAFTTSGKFQKTILIFIGLMAIFGALFGLFFYRDEDGDGKQDSKLAYGIQPTGEDAKTDLIYSEVNQGNAKANVFEASAFAIIALVAVVFIFFVGFVAIMLSRVASHNSIFDDD